LAPGRLAALRSPRHGLRGQEKEALPGRQLRRVDGAWLLIVAGGNLTTHTKG